jgi:hypothetical protein
MVPELFFAEFANVLWKAEHHGWYSHADAGAAIESVVKSWFPSFRSSELIKPALGIARA